MLGEEVCCMWLLVFLCSMFFFNCIFTHTTEFSICTLSQSFHTINWTQCLIFTGIIFWPQICSQKEHDTLNGFVLPTIFTHTSSKRNLFLINTADKASLKTKTGQLQSRKNMTEGTFTRILLGILQHQSILDMGWTWSVAYTITFRRQMSFKIYESKRNISIWT